MKYQPVDISKYRIKGIFTILQLMTIVGLSAALGTWLLNSVAL